MAARSNVDYFGSEGPKRKPKASGSRRTQGEPPQRRRTPRRASGSSAGERSVGRNTAAARRMGSEGPKRKPKASGVSGGRARELGAEGPKRRVGRNPRRAQVEYYGSEGPKRKPKASGMGGSRARTMGSEGPKGTRRSPRKGAGAEGPKRKAKASGSRARKEMSATVRRQTQNRGVKSGTVRTGAKGKTMRRYNARTGRWNVVSVSQSRKN